MNEAFLTLTLSELGAGEGLIGWSLMVSAASEIPIFFLLSKYGDKMKEPLLTFASLMFALRFLLMALAADPLSVLAVQSLHSITFGVFYVTAVRILQGSFLAVPSDRHGSIHYLLVKRFRTSQRGLRRFAVRSGGRPAFYQLAPSWPLSPVSVFFTGTFCQAGGYECRRNQRLTHRNSTVLKPRTVLHAW